MGKKIERCSKCILSASFPLIEFDENGICNFCNDKSFITTEDTVIEDAKKKISEIISGLGSNSAYDAIMCYSGGKDSTYTLSLAVEKYNLKVLSFVLDNGYISKKAFENINRVVEHLGVDHITFKPSIKFFKELIKASALNPIYNFKTLTRISSICNSCISIVNMTALKLAVEKNIPLIISGFTLGQIPSNGIIYKNNYEFLKDSREASLSKLRNIVGKEIDKYFCLSDSLVAGIKDYPTTLNLLCVERITENEILDKIQKFGWSPPKDVDGCSSNCRLNTFNNFIHEKTFGYSPYELELSHLIRKGLMTREEALKKIQDQPEEELQNIIEELNIDEEKLSRLSENYRRK